MRSEARQISWMTAAQIGTQVVGLLTSFLLAKLLDPAIFGVVAMALFSVLIVRRLLADGVSAYVVSLRDDQLRNADAAGIIGILVSLVAAIVMIATARLFAESAGPEFRTTLLAFSIIPAIEAAGSVQNGLIQRERKFKALALRSIIASLLSALAGILVAWIAGGVWALIAQQFAQVSLTSLFSIILSKWRPRSWPSLSSLRVTCRGFLALSMTSFAAVTLGRVDVLVVGALHGAAAAGTYSFAKRIVETVRDSIGTSLGSVVMSASTARNVADSASVTTFALKIVILLLIPAAVGLSIISPRLVALTLGDAWSGASVPLSILSLSLPAQVAMNVYNSTLIGRGEHRVSAISNTVSVLSFPPLLLMTLYSQYGAAAAFLVNSLVGVTSILVLSKGKLPPISDIRPAIILAITSSTIMASVIYLASITIFQGQNGVLVTAGLILGGGAAYLISAYFGGKNIVKELLRSIQ